MKDLGPFCEADTRKHIPSVMFAFLLEFIASCSVTDLSRSHCVPLGNDLRFQESA
jgi:hypothetical protein